MEEKLLKKLSGLGYPLSGLKDDDADLNLILAKMVDSEDIRIPAIFPVMLAISAEQGAFNYEDCPKTTDLSRKREILKTRSFLSRCKQKN